jgi:hypothetical protein
MNLKQTHRARSDDIEAVCHIALQLDLQPLNEEVVQRIAQFGLSALVECTLAAQDGALSSALRARFLNDVADRIRFGDEMRGADTSISIDEVLAA